MKALDFSKNVEIMLRDAEELLGRQELIRKIEETIGTEEVVKSIGTEELLKQMDLAEVERLLAEMKKSD